MTLFGNASSQHLAYDQWHRRRRLTKITNNEANCVIVDTSAPELPLYVTNRAFAQRGLLFDDPIFSPDLAAWRWGSIR